MGDPGLFHLENINELADAKVPFREEQNDPKAGSVRQGFENVDDVLHVKQYTLYENIFIYYSQRSVNSPTTRGVPGLTRTCVLG